MKFDVDKMDRVCEDEKSVWYFDEEKEAFVRIYPQTKQYNYIMGKFLPDPKKTWEARIQTNPKNARKPTNATFALWDRWNKHLAQGT